MVGGISANSIADCDNANVSGGDHANDFQSKVGNRTIQKYIADQICTATTYNTNGSIQVGTNLDVWGDNRCDGQGPFQWIIQPPSQWGGDGQGTGGGNIPNFFAFCHDVKGGAWSQHGDSDGIPNFLDNCDGVHNPDQADMDGDGQGDLCETSDSVNLNAFGAKITQNVTATASSTSSQWGGAPNRAIDGNTNGIWGGGSVTHTNTQNNPWLQVDLGGTYPLGLIRVFNRTDCCADRLTNFNVEILDASGNLVWRDANLNRSSPKPVTAIQGLDGGTQGQATFGRYVRISLNGNNRILSLAELEVYQARSDKICPDGQAFNSKDNTCAMPFAEKAADILFYMCPNGLDNCKHGKAFTQFVEFDASLGVDLNWGRFMQRVFTGAEIIPHQSKCLNQNGNTNNPVDCFAGQNNINASSLFENANTVFDAHVSESHYSWGYHHFEQYVDFTDDDGVYHSDWEAHKIPVLIPPQKRRDDYLVAIDMSHEACHIPMSEAKGPWPALANAPGFEANCRFRLPINGNDYESSKYRSVSFEEVSTVVRIDDRLFDVNLCAASLHQETWGVYFTDPEPLTLSQRTTLGNLAQVVECALSKEAFETLENQIDADKILNADAVPVIVGAGLMMLGPIVETLEAAALVVDSAEAADGLSALAQGLKGVSAGANLAMNVTFLIEGGQSFKACRSQNNKHACQAAALGQMIIAGAFIGLDAYSAISKSEIYSKFAGGFQAGDIVASEQELESLLDETDIAYNAKIEDETPSGLTDHDPVDPEETNGVDDNPTGTEVESPPNNGCQVCPCLF